MYQASRKPSRGTATVGAQAGIEDTYDFLLSDESEWRQ